MYTLYIYIYIYVWSSGAWTSAMSGFRSTEVSALPPRTPLSRLSSF